MLPAEAKTFYRGVSVTDAATTRGVAAVTLGNQREKLGCHNDPRLLRSARSYARLVRQTMKIGLTALTLRPACVLGVFFVKEKGDRLRLIADCRKANALFAPPPLVDLLSGDGLARIEVDTAGLVPGEPPGLHYGCADVADWFFVSLGRFAIFLLARCVEQIS